MMRRIEAARPALVNFLLALLTAGLLIITHPRANLSLLAPLALVPLLLALARETRPIARFLLGYAAGVAYWFGLCYWIQFVLEVYGGMGRWGGWGTFLLFCFIKAIHFGVFALVAGIVIHRWWALPSIAALWVAVEGAPQAFGFTWLALGNAGITMSVPMRLAPFAGVYGLSFVFALLNAALAVTLLRRPKTHLLWLLALGGLYSLPALPEPRLGRQTAVMVQPGISMSEQWTKDSVEVLEEKMSSLSLQTALASAQKPELLLWPEVPAPFYYYGDAGFREKMGQLARVTGSYFLFGTVAYRAPDEPLNSAVMLSPKGGFVGRYDKVKLVPFGEYVPEVFSFVKRITQEAGDFTPGKELVVLPTGPHRLGAFICYESVFPDLVRRFVVRGAEVLVNLSNDGYFGTSAAREQHLDMVRMRAAENRRWILRATNDGITASIDPSGRIAVQLSPFVQTAMRARFSYVSDKTFYSEHGDWFVLLCAGIGLLSLLATQIPAYSPRDQSE